jgi:hypothetical protein
LAQPFALYPNCQKMAPPPPPPQPQPQQQSDH